MRVVSVLFLSVILNTAGATPSQNKNSGTRSEPSRAPVIRIGAHIPYASALELVKPDYPGEWRVTGSAVVRVKIDRSGHVVSARATSGHPLLKSVVVDAARRSIFKRNSDDRRKFVTGTITYIFSLADRSYDDLKSLIGKQVTLSGKFSLYGKIGPFILIAGRPVYLVAKDSFSWGSPYSEMVGKVATVTGILKFYQNKVKTVPGAVAAGIPEYFYFEAESATVRLQ